MSSRKTTYFPLPQRIISKYDFCRRHHTVEKSLSRVSGIFHTVENRRVPSPSPQDAG